MLYRYRYDFNFLIIKFIKVQVGWSVAGPGETHGFIPEEIEVTLEKHDQEISSKLDRPDPGPMIAIFAYKNVIRNSICRNF